MIFVPVEPQQILIDHMRRSPLTLGFLGMGLGKTAAVLSHLSELFLSGQSVAALVVAPLRVSQLTWPMEAESWDQLRWMRIANLRTENGQRAFLNGRGHIYTINYESLPLLVSLVERRKGKLPFDTVVFDELTRAKNPGSKRINLFRRKIPRVERYIGLTGTPMPNSARDLFAQVRLIDNGERLGTHYTNFVKEYFHVTTYGGFPQYEEKHGTTQRLEKKISDLTVTLKSSDYLDIPDTVLEDVEIQFDPDLQKRYRKLENDLVIELRKDKTINIASSAALVTKLLQFTSGKMYCDEKVDHFIHSLKFDALRGIISKEKQPVFVACMFKHEYSRMKEFFPKAVFFNDAKTPEQQTQLMKDWSAKRIPILFAHPASVGHGLNLQFGSSTLVFLSLTYNREHYDQTICRFARRGQTEITKVYRIVVPGTVDDAVAEALATKASNEARLISALQMLEAMRSK